MDNNHEIFQFLKPFQNDQLSSLSGIDIQTFIILLNNYYLELRQKLHLDRQVSFGLEIEFEHVDKEGLEKELYQNFPRRNWLITDDASLKEGAEINSPIMQDKEITWKHLAKVCEITRKFAKIDKDSSGHIHIGTQILGNNLEAWLRFLKIWSVYENIIFRFANGEYLTTRPRIMEYAAPVRRSFKREYEKSLREEISLIELFRNLKYNRYLAVNFRNIDIYHPDVFERFNTLEFRLPNGTLDATIWQNNINFFVKLLSYTKSSLFDMDVILKREKDTFSQMMDLRLYDEIFLQQALELSDLIFDNNLDKIYFLKQYLKAYQISKNHDNFVKGPILTKK